MKRGGYPGGKGADRKREGRVGKKSSISTGTMGRKKVQERCPWTKTPSYGRKRVRRAEN